MTDRTMCADTKHDFDKFDDATIYCRNCGEHALLPVAPCPLNHYPTTWWVQPYQPYKWGTTTISFDTTSVASGALTGASYTSPASRS